VIFFGTGAFEANFGPTALAELVTDALAEGHLDIAVMDSFLIAIALKLGLAGYGKDGLGEGFDYTRPEHYYLAMAANLAFGDKDDGSQTLPAADEEELRIFREARAHLPASVYDEAVWAASVPGDLWLSVVYMLNRGGRYAPASKAYSGDKLGHPWKGTWHLYIEKVAKGIDSMTGEHFDGLPRYEPIKDALGNEIDDVDYPLTLLTYKEIVGGQSRTMRIMDFGKVAATFVDTHTGNAVRIHPHPDCRDIAKRYVPAGVARWQAMLTAYQTMPDEELLIAQPVALTVSLAAIISRPKVRTNCDHCGEEIINEREEWVSGECLCRACAGEAYYAIAVPAFVSVAQ